VLRGADLIGAGRDATFPMPDGPWPATGAVLAAVETATGVTASTVGKPEPQLFQTALDRFAGGGGAPPDRSAGGGGPSPIRSAGGGGPPPSGSAGGGRLRALVVGDRLDADVGGAAAAELDAAIVLTGATAEEDAREALAAAEAARRQPTADAPRAGGLVAVEPTLAALLLS